MYPFKKYWLTSLYTADAVHGVGISHSSSYPDGPANLKTPQKTALRPPLSTKRELIRKLIASPEGTQAPNTLLYTLLRESRHKPIYCN